MIIRGSYNLRAAAMRRKDVGGGGYTVGGRALTLQIREWIVRRCRDGFTANEIWEACGKRLSRPCISKIMAEDRRHRAGVEARQLALKAPNAR